MRKLAEQTPLATQAREMIRTGASKAEVAAVLDIHEALIDGLVGWADEYVTPEVTTARQFEIAAVNRQQSTLFNIWNKLDEEQQTLETFKTFNREFLELSKARRLLGGLDAPARSESKVTVEQIEPKSIDAEVARLESKLRLHDPAPLEGPAQ